MNIVVARANHMAAFKPYLEAQMLENGDGQTPLFMPLSRAQCHLSIDVQGKFANRLALPLTNPNWRRLWLVFDEQQQLIGHIDLRGTGQEHTAHRALLGMGMNLEARGKGLGKKLIAHVVDWAKGQPLEYIDLSVMGGNIAGVKLYRHSGFSEVGRFNDMYRVDGQVVDEIHMSLKIA